MRSLFEMLGMNVNSLGRRANPVCLCIAKKEEAVAYEHMYSSTEAGVFDLVHNLKLCKPSKKCEMCNAVREQIEQEPMRERAQQYLDDPSLLRAIIADGNDKARAVAQETMRDVREAMGLAYT